MIDVDDIVESAAEDPNDMSSFTKKQFKTHDGSYNQNQFRVQTTLECEN